jgi:DNA-binding response OmpR family regulator
MLVGVAEDDPDITFLLEMFLSESGYDVAMAQDGVGALSMCRDQRPDVLLLDFTMPGGLNGRDVVTRLKADPDTAGMPVLMLSARTDEEHMNACLEAGAAAYLVKPFPMDELVELLAAHAAGTSD